ncbi:ubiquitin-protein ligase E3B [Neocloeon triangulifer]|uniref:ubiquitin-protein ligase E3B n=1 Tax=Neocloeon triangulifer TaxID=2078957 RepID=UPI00286F4ADC|nr:ubiquitin-protein ligase E3B [Neocloeon triangulifer]
MFPSNDSKKGNFLEQTKAAREERALEKKRENAAIKIQSQLRGFCARKRFRSRVISEFDALIGFTEKGSNSKIQSIQLFHSTTRLLLVWDKKLDKDRIEKLCGLLVDSLAEDKAQLSYIGVALNREHSIYWISHIKKLLWMCCQYMEGLSPELAADSRSLLLFLRTLVSFTSITTWAILRSPAMEKLNPGMNKLCANIIGDLVNRGFLTTLKRVLIKGLCGSKPSLKQVSLSALFKLTLRPLVLADFSEKLLSMFLINIVSVPALLHHLTIISPECINQLVSNGVFKRSMTMLSSEQDLRIVFNTLEGNYALCLLANLIHMAHIEKDDSLKELYFPTFICVVSRMLECCQKYVGNKRSEVTHWHPVLGWFAQGLDLQLQASMPLVRRQLSYLWAAPLVSILLSDLNQIVQETGVPDPVASAPITFAGSSMQNNFNSMLKKVLDRPNKSGNIKYVKLGSPECTRVAMMASLYQTSLSTLTQLKLDILTGLCYQNGVLHLLWQFLWTLGPLCGLKAFLGLLDVDSNGTCPEFQMLTLFCDCMNHYILILDDIEMYEQQKPFRVGDYVLMSNFLNQFAYKAVLGGLFDAKSLHGNALFNAVLTLLLRLYQRDCRRQYTPDGHWLLKDIKISTFISDLEKGKKANQIILQKMPHIIPQDERVQIFRRHVANEKTSLGITESSCHSSSTLITIHRSRIVEDGYSQLATLNPQSLKGVIRVRFVNEQGLFEAGIDQHGVFKEFLEETIKRVFDPSLNLFRTTADERLYPSPTSALQDNHLQLFEFVGRMLGKAVYEGIVVDVPFASFFLSQLLGSQHQAYYSSIDELPSLDEELYRSLTYIKHHQGDVSELDLNFSIDQDYLGKLETFELVPGGRATPVTNENKINYIHLMAHFRMHIQIREQTAAFIRGFRSIINTDWLSLFSTPELQRLISGDNSPLDLKDLRRNTQYYGGFHDSHKVIGWLWDVLESDFSELEKRHFLKFVTSCSKPPLLGFAHLEPPFSIRCVEVGDDEDTGDTIGSVIRGFFTIRKKDPQHRLPTSSTCFNLLKLPNYQRKSTLREKLRYAISSNTGFELS